MPAGPQVPEPWQPSRRQRWLVTLLVLTGVALALYWERGIADIDNLPGWFYLTSRDLPLGPVLFALVVGAAPSVARYAIALTNRGRTTCALGLLMLLGIAAQVTLHFLMPEGIEQSYGRLFHGHGQFLRTAALRRGLLLPTLRDYESLSASGQLGSFSGTKAPGTLGFYMLIDALAQWQPLQWLLGPLIAATRASKLFRTPEAGALLLVLFPVLTYLTLVPLVSLARHLFHDERIGIDAALLYVSAPALLLIDLHTDGALYPLLGMSSLALSVAGVRTSSPVRACLGGVLASLGVYCTFGLLTVVPVTLLFAIILASQRGIARREGEGPWYRCLQVHDRVPLWSLSALFAGMALTLIALVLWLDFQPWVRFAASLAYHETWKREVPTLLWRALSLVEFGLYAGPPLMLTLAIACFVSIDELRARRVSMLSLWTVTVVVLLGLLAITQGTTEVARIWMFTIPLIALAAAGLLRREPDSTGLVLRTLAATQVVLTLIMKVRQPW